MSWAAADLARVCGVLERSGQTAGDLAEAEAEASAAASDWMATAAERASEWAADPARDQEWERAVERLARIKPPPIWQTLCDGLWVYRAKVERCSGAIVAEEALNRPLRTRGASVALLAAAVAKVGAAANQALIRGPLPAPFNQLPVLRKALVAPPGSELAGRLAAEDRLAPDVAGVRAEMAVSATVQAAQLMWSAAMALHQGMETGTALEQANAALRHAELIGLLDRLIEPPAIQPPLFDCGM
ncbi:hypothetical protein [Candidatus Poriferisocius sp.]|uniref:hypothetical protein n=1 Tax=Candidatus Poriferisocius sp. TaxID=3101276 RepID=UPI003B01DB50